MTKAAFDKIHEGLTEALALVRSEPVGERWLEEFRAKFEDEFPAEDKIAQRSIEANVAADRSKQSRFGRQA